MHSEETALRILNIDLFLGWQYVLRSSVSMLGSAGDHKGKQLVLCRALCC